MEEQQLRIAAHWLNDDYEGQRWPTLQEVYQLLILTLNRKYVIRRKLCGFRPLLRSEFFTSGEYSLEFFLAFFYIFGFFLLDNLGNTVVDERRASKKTAKSQSAKNSVAPAVSAEVKNSASSQCPEANSQLTSFKKPLIPAVSSTVTSHEV